MLTSKSIVSKGKRGAIKNLIKLASSRDGVNDWVLYSIHHLLSNIFFIHLKVNFIICLL